MLRIRHGVNDYVSQIIYVDMENMAKILLMSCIDRSSHFPIAYIQLVMYVFCAYFNFEYF